MSNFSDKVRAFFIKHYFLNNCASVSQNGLGQPIRMEKNYLGTKLSTRWVDKFENGMFVMQNEPRSGRPKTARTPENIQVAKEVIEENPKISGNKLAQIVGTSTRSVGRILKDDLGLKSYKSQIKQQLSRDAPEKRYDFANTMLELLDSGEVDVNKIIFTDESHFYLNNEVYNRQNCRIWGTERPVFCSVRPLHPVKVTVWAGIWSGGVIGPYFFPSTVNADAYNWMLESYFLPKLQNTREYGDFWFMQDGAPPHRTKGTWDLICPRFGSNIIALNCPTSSTPWPPYSPDLNVCDFFLWGYLKDQVYRNNPQTEEELKNAIIEAFEEIPPAYIARSCNAFKTRLRHLVVTEGSHFEQLIK